MDKNNEMKFMKGSSGTADYLLLAEVDGLGVGIKPLLDVIPIKVTPADGSKHFGMALGVGVRLRVAYHGTVKGINAGKAAKDRFPKVKFAKAADTHASLVLGTGRPLAKGDTQKGVVDSIVEPIFMTALEELNERMDGVLFSVLPREVLAEWFRGIAEKAIGKLNIPKEPEEGKSAAVYQFPGKFHTKH